MKKIKTGIITYNRPDELRRALISCIDNGMKCTKDIIVWDNHSDEILSLRNKEICNELGVNYFYSDDNLGVAGGRNKIWQMIKSDYVFFLDFFSVLLV